jgi:hypothetical protein
MYLIVTVSKTLPTIARGNKKRMTAGQTLTLFLIKLSYYTGTDSLTVRKNALALAAQHRDNC